MLHVLTLFSVSEESAAFFTQSIRRGGDWHTHACQFSPDWIATDLLEHLDCSMPFFLKSCSRLFLTIDFWSSHEAHLATNRSPEIRALLLKRRRMATSAFELGAFQTPTAIEARKKPGNHFRF